MCACVRETRLVLHKTFVFCNLHSYCILDPVPMLFTGDAFVQGWQCIIAMSYAGLMLLVLVKPSWKATCVLWLNKCSNDFFGEIFQDAHLPVFKMLALNCTVKKRSKPVAM